MAEDEAMTNENGATHIRLVCWAKEHVQAISADQLRQLTVAPICSAVDPPEGHPNDLICGSRIWAVEHDGEPTRYVGRGPHENWQSWADCIGGT